MTVATLGLEIDSSQAAPAVAALDKLTVAATSAQSAATKLMPATAAVNAPMAAMGRAASTAAVAHAALSTQGMAAFHSMRSLAEGLAMGLSPTQALAMQLNHLSYAASAEGGIAGAFKEAASMLTGFLTPVRLMAVGIAAASVAAYALNAAWKTSALQLDDTARSIGVTVTQLRALESAASVKGIEDFSTAAEKFSASIYDASNGMGSLGEFLRANGARATDFAGTMASVASIIQRAGTDQQRLQLLQQAGLPATMQWVRFLQQGPDAIKDAVSQSSQLSSKEQELIDKAREFDQRWAETWANFKSAATQAIIGTKAALQELSDIAQNPQQYDPYQSGLGIPPSAIVPPSGSPLNGPTRVDITLPKPRPANIPQTAPAIDKNALLNSLQQYQTFIGLLGDIATTDQTVKAKEDALSAAWIQSGVSVGKYKDAILALTATQHDYSRASLQAQMGVQTFDVQAMAAKEVAANIKAGLVPLDQYNNALTASINKWKSLSEQAQVAGSNFPQLTQLALDAGNLNKQLDTLAVGGLNDLSDGLVSIMNGTATVGDAFKNMGAQVVTALEKMIIQMTIVQPIANSLKMALGGSGGGGLLSLFGLNIGHNAMGTDNWRGGLTMVGEQGPELVNLPRGAQVVPNNKVASVLSSGGGQAIQISITNAPVFNNADPTVEARLRQQIAQTAADTQQKTIAAVAKLNQNSPGNYLPRGR